MKGGEKVVGVLLKAFSSVLTLKCINGSIILLDLGAVRGTTVINLQIQVIAEANAPHVPGEFRFEKKCFYLCSYYDWKYLTMYI